MSARRISRGRRANSQDGEASTRSEMLPGSKWQVTMNPRGNMAYIWFEAAEDTYVDYDHGLRGGVAYPIRHMEGDRVVGVFVQDLPRGYAASREDRSGEEDAAALGLLAERDWAPGSFKVAASRVLEFRRTK